MDLQASMAQIELPGGAKIVLEALDPASDAPDAGVTIAQVAISGAESAPAGKPSVTVLSPLLAFEPSNV